MPPADEGVTAVSPALLRSWPLPEVEDGGYKHARGTVLVVGGASSTPGAVLLAGLAALRVGAGKLQVLTPNGGELAALLDGADLDGRQAAVEVARRCGAIVSAPGWVSGPDGACWCLEAGGIGLGTSGSGDVLAGLVGVCAGPRAARRGAHGAAPAATLIPGASESTRVGAT